MIALKDISSIISLIISFGTLITMFVTFAKIIQTPNKTQDQRLDEIEKRLDKHDRYFESDHQSIDSLKHGNAVTMKSIAALMTHAIDGNHTEELKDASKEMTNFLYDNGIIGKAD